MHILHGSAQRISVVPPVAPIAAPEATEADIEAMFLIRGFEPLLLDLFSRGALNGTTHTCLGQEYIPVALSPLFEAHDFIFSNHRGHGHYLARFGDVEGLLLEIMGRAGGVCNGVGGSQHLFRDGFLSADAAMASLPQRRRGALDRGTVTGGFSRVGEGDAGRGGARPVGRPTAPRQALRSFRIRVSQMAAKGRTSPTTIETMNKAPS